MSKSAQRMFLARVVGIGGYFMTKSGGEISASVTKAYDGGSDRPDIITGPREIDNITVSRVFDPDRDGPLLRTLRKRVGVWATKIAVSPTDRNYSTQDKPVVYDPVVLIRIKEPDVDAASSDAATFELEFAVSDVR